MANSQVERLSNPVPTISYRWAKLTDSYSDIGSGRLVSPNYDKRDWEPSFEQSYSSEVEAIKDFSRVNSEYLKLFPETFKGFDLILVKSYRFDTFEIKIPI